MRCRPKKPQQKSPLSRKEPEKERPSKTERFYPVTTLLPQTLHKTSMASPPSMPAEVERGAQTPTLVRLWWAALTTVSWCHEGQVGSWDLYPCSSNEGNCGPPAVLEGPHGDAVPSSPPGSNETSFHLSLKWCRRGLVDGQDFPSSNGATLMVSTEADWGLCPAASTWQ